MGIVIIAVLVVIFLLLWAIIDIVPQSEARVMERLGIFRAVWGAGIHLRFPILDRCAYTVDLREQVVELPKVTHGAVRKTRNQHEDWDGYDKGYELHKLTVSPDQTPFDKTLGLWDRVRKSFTGSYIDRDNDRFSGKSKGYDNYNSVEYSDNTYYSDHQGVITKDNVVMDVDAAVFYQITDPKMYAYGMKQPIFALQKLTVTTLRNIIGTLNLDETLCSRDLINSKLRAALDEATDNWGIKITRVEIEEIIPPADIQKAMHAQAYAERMRRAIVLEAEGVAERNRLMNETAPTEAVIKMLAIQAMPEVANGKSNTVIIPSEIQGLVGLAKGVIEGVKTPTTEN